MTEVLIVKLFLFIFPILMVFDFDITSLLLGIASWAGGTQDFCCSSLEGVLVCGGTAGAATGGGGAAPGAGDAFS